MKEKEQGLTNTQLNNQTDGSNRCCEKIIHEIREVRNDIKNSIKPQFLNVSVQTKDLVEHATELWRMETRFNKILSTMDKDIAKSISNSFKKLRRYLEKNDIEIIDYTNHKYDEGLNLEILAVEKDSAVESTIIKETKEPTITFKGEVVRRGKIIIVQKEDKEEVPKDE